MGGKNMLPKTHRLKNGMSFLMRALFGKRIVPVIALLMLAFVMLSSGQAGAQLPDDRALATQGAPEHSIAPPLLTDTPTDTPTSTPTPTNTPDPCAPVWSVVSSPNVGTRSNYLNGVKAVSANDVWAVGYYYNNVGMG